MISLKECFSNVTLRQQQANAKNLIWKYMISSKNWYPIFSSRTLIDKPQQQVFNFVANLENFSKFYPSIVAMKQPQGLSPAPGVGYEEELKGFGSLANRHFITSITELDTPNKLGLTTEDETIKLQVYYYFYSTENRTTEVLYHAGSYKNFSLFFKLFIIPLFKIRLAFEIKAALNNLKQLLEKP